MLPIAPMGSLIAGCPWRGRSRPTRSTGSSASVAAARRRPLGRITESHRPSERDQSGLVNMARKSSSARFNPSSVNTTDLALLTGSPIRPFHRAGPARIPIKPLPGAPVVMAGQIEERQHRFVDLVRVERHPRTVPDLRELRWGSWPHAYVPQPAPNFATDPVDLM